MTVETVSSLEAAVAEAVAEAGVAEDEDAPQPEVPTGRLNERHCRGSVRHLPTRNGALPPLLEERARCRECCESELKKKGQE